MSVTHPYGTLRWFPRLVRSIAVLVIAVLGFTAAVPIAGTDTAGAAPMPPTVGENRILVIMAYWGAKDTQTPAAVKKQVFRTYNNYFREVSYNQFGIRGDVTPWLQIPAPSSCSEWMGGGFDEITAAKTKAKAAGFDAANYDRIVLYTPGDCDFSIGGWSWIPAVDIVINGALYAFPHELGHALGLQHSSFYRCADSGGSPMTLGLPGECHTPTGQTDPTDIGDGYDAMGWGGPTGPYHFNAYQKHKLGWLAGHVAALSTTASNNSTTLVPYEQVSNGMYAARIEVGGGREYWLEYRRQIGADAALPADAVNGVVLHLFDPAVSGKPLLLDGDPAAPGAEQPLPAGSSWTSPEGITITVGTATAAGIKVSVARAPRDVSVDQLTSGPSAVMTTSTHTDVYFKGSNGHLFVIGRDAGGPWGPAVDLGGVVLGSDPSAVAPTTTHTDVYYKGPNGHLFVSSHDDGGWWSAPTDLGAVASSGPSAVTTRLGRTDVYYKGPNGHLFVMSRERLGRWSTPTDLGGVVLASDPSAVATSATHTDVYYKGPNGHLFVSSHDDGGWWSAPTDLGGVVLGSGPSAVAPSVTRTNVYYKGPNGHLFVSSHDDGGWWSAPTDLGGTTLFSDPSAVQSGGSTFVYFKGHEGHLMVTW